MLVTDVPFGEWLPAVPSYKNPGCIVADNVIPSTGGYRSQPALVARGETVAGQCRGARLFWRIGGTTALAGGTETSLFTNSSGTVATTTGLNDVGSGEAWDFAQFNDFIVATAVSNPPKYLDDIDTDTSWGNLPGSPPSARYVERVEDFLMLGNIADFPNRIHWSAFNAPTASWAADRLTQAGFADLPRAFGPVRRIVGGRYPMVFQERGVSRIEYVGPPVVWRASEIEQARGAVAPFSVVTVGFLTYFLAQDGFWATDGQSFQPIGSQRVNSWFFNAAESSTIQQTHGAIDWFNECVVWAFKSAGSGVFDRLIRYSYAENRWSSGTVTVARLVEASDAGITLEQLSDLFGDLETVPASLDDERWRSRFRSLAAYVDGSTRTDLATFSGLSSPARIETGEFQPQPGSRVMVTGARPLSDTTASICCFARQNNGIETPGTFTAAGPDGFCPQRADGQTMRLGLRFDKNWAEIQGAQVRFRVSGLR